MSAATPDIGLVSRGSDSMRRSPLAAVAMASSDPILGLTEAFNADTHSSKANLGQGIYCNDEGKVPVLECVWRAKNKLLDPALAHGYLPIDGLAAYSRAVQDMVFGADSEAVRQGRVVTVQTLGGTGALKVGADLLRHLDAGAEVWISDPSWENHRTLFEYAGFKVNTYRYYDPHTRGLDLGGMLASFERIPPGSIVVLHACCHNPTGVDATTDDWLRIVEIVRTRRLVPFVDSAYQGFAESLEADSAVVRLFVEACPVVFVSSSFSKSLSLYGERVGALSVVTEDTDQMMRTLSQVKRIIRAIYSSPPSFGARIAELVLATPELTALWHRELGEMRERIKMMRVQLVDAIRASRADFDFDSVIRQRGMFSYTGLTREQVQRLRSDHSVYVLGSGRICVAALNSRNIGYVAEAIARVLV
jgi:aromatic-amino-acid transaminase